MRNEALEAWEFGDPIDVASRREAREAGKRKATEQLLKHKRRLIKALVKLAMRKARMT